MIEKTGSEENRHVASVVHRNIAALLEHKQTHEDKKSMLHKLADKVARKIGSSSFLVFQVLLVIVWLVLNSWSFQWEQYPFSGLSLIVTLEALFISIFILITQNQSARLAEQRADLSLQINLLTEHEITRLLGLVESLMKHQGMKGEALAGLEDLKEEATPQAIMEEIEKSTQHPPKET